MAGFSIPLDEVVHFDAVTHSPSTGAVSDADSTPTFDVYEEANDTGLLGATNFTKRTSLTGNYRGTFTASAANGFEVGKWYNVIASATVGAIAGKAVCLTFMLRAAEHTAGYEVVTVKDGTGTGEINTNAGKVVGVELVDVLTTYTGNTPQTGDVFPLASTEIADIKAKTDQLTFTVANVLDANVLRVGGNATVPTNMIVVFATDFAANYNTTLDQWSVNIESWNATAVPAEHTAGYPIVTVKDGTGTGEINTNAGAVALVDLVTTTSTATAVTTVNGLAANVITAASIATGAIDADALAADAIDEFWDEAMTELSSVPGVTASLRDAIRWLFILSRNKITQTATTQLVRNDADAATIGTSTLSDDATTFIRGEFA